MNSRPSSHQVPDDNNPTVRLGRKLREARKVAGYASTQAMAVALNCDRSYVSRIENGRLAPSDKILKLWCKLCGVDAELYEAQARLARTAEESPVPPWFQDFFGAQRLAHTVRTWQNTIVPGPFQIPDYSRPLYAAVGEDDERIEELILARAALQELFMRPKHPVTLLAVIDEFVLRRLVGSEDVMHRQLSRLVELGQLRHIGLQVVPARRGCNAGHVGAFTIASVPNAPDVMLMGAVEDVPSDQPSTVLRAHAIFDRVRLDALSKAESLEYIGELAEQLWKPRQ